MAMDFASVILHNPRKVWKICPDIASAIKALAARNRSRDLGGELIVPRRILAMMEEKYQSGLPLGELCKIYVDAYYKKEVKGQ